MTPLNWNLDLVIRTMQQLTNYLNEKACKVQGWDITPRTYWLDLLGLAWGTLIIWVTCASSLVVCIE
jgi:hypothetical protein